MSETESFESVMEAAMPLLSGDCVFESCPDEHDDCTHCAIYMADRLKRAHDREIRDTAQQEFHRGFEDGQHSMDAEHRAIAMRLHGLRFDGGSHENLARIAYAIYPCATGWTCESAAGLRDKLIDLMGGVSDDTCGAGCCCAAADSDGDCGLQREEVEHGGAAHDCAADSRGGAGSELVYMDGLTTYDVLGNERRRVIAKLRKVCTGLDESVWTWIEDVAIAIGAQDEPNDEYESMLPKITDRLIHLLGGDKPSGIDAMNSYEQRIEKLVRQRDEARTERDELRGEDVKIKRQYAKLCVERADLLDLLRDARDEYKTLDQMSAETSANFHAMRDRVWGLEAERDELQEKLDKLYRHESTKSVVNGLIVGTYTKAEAIKRIEQIYGDD